MQKLEQLPKIDSEENVMDALWFLHDGVKIIDGDIEYTCNLNCLLHVMYDYYLTTPFSDSVIP